MTTAPFPVLFEDNHLLVVSKPAGLPTMGVAADLSGIKFESRIRCPQGAVVRAAGRLDREEVASGRRA